MDFVKNLETKHIVGGGWWSCYLRHYDALLTKKICESPLIPLIAFFITIEKMKYNRNNRNLLLEHLEKREKTLGKACKTKLQFSFY